MSFCRIFKIGTNTLILFNILVNENLSNMISGIFLQGVVASFQFSQTKKKSDAAIQNNEKRPVVKWTQFSLLIENIFSMFLYLLSTILHSFILSHHARMDYEQNYN